MVESRALSRWLPRQPGVHDGLEVVGRGGLALGAGDAGDLQRPGGVAVGPVGQQAHGLPDVGDLDAGQGHLRVGRLADVGKGPLPHGVPQVLGLELRPLADKQGVGDHHFGVAGHQRHRAGGVGGQGGVVRQQLVAEQQLIVVPQGETGSVHLVHHLVWNRARDPDAPLDSKAAGKPQCAHWGGGGLTCSAGSRPPRAGLRPGPPPSQRVGGRGGRGGFACPGRSVRELLGRWDYCKAKLGVHRRPVFLVLMSRALPRLV